MGWEKKNKIVPVFLLPKLSRTTAVFLPYLKRCPTIVANGVQNSFLLCIYLAASTAHLVSSSTAIQKPWNKTSRVRSFV